MSYTPRKDWVDNTAPAGQPPSAGATPILADDLDYIEAGLVSAADVADDALTGLALKADQAAVTTALAGKADLGPDGKVLTAQLPAASGTSGAAFTVTDDAGNVIAGVTKIVYQGDGVVVSGDTATITVGGLADTAPPSTPTLMATPGNQQVSLTASGATDNVAVTGYRFFRDGTLIVDQSSPTYVDTGRTNGTAYSYTARAYDAAGNVSAASAAVSATPAAAATVPGQVTGLTGTPSANSVALMWTAPSNGGSPITDYIIEFRTGANAFAVFADGTNTNTSGTVTGLAPSTSYDFRVSAVNAIGTGAPSAVFTTSTTAAVTDLAADNFNRSASPTTLGTASDGKVWQVATGSTPLGVSATQTAYAGGTTAGTAIQYLVATGEDYEVRADIVLLPTATTERVGIMARWNNDAYAWVDVNNAGILRLAKKVGGTTTVVFTSAAGAVAAGAAVALTASGSTFTAKVNGTTVGSFTEVGLAAGEPGFRWTTGTSIGDARLDNFRAVAA